MWYCSMDSPFPPSLAIRDYLLWQLFCQGELDFSAKMFTSDEIIGQLSWNATGTMEAMPPFFCIVYEHLNLHDQTIFMCWYMVHAYCREETKIAKPSQCFEMVCLCYNWNGKWYVLFGEAQRLFAGAISCCHAMPVMTGEGWRNLTAGSFTSD